ncbi:MAG: class I SAM-dependent methyltransferase [Planctomyces sp.]|nr:class I SAM-dependent methyltransferase [Planctomyces sp.]
MPQSDADSIVRTLLRETFQNERIGEKSGAFTRSGMSINELPRLYELVRRNAIRNVLEIGMGHATSSIVISRALADGGGGHLTSIDPFQTAQEKPGYASVGIQNLKRAGFADHKLIELPDYLALPQLVADKAAFDFILVDGYHSFDYTLLDIFYADLLLRDGGVLCVHDSSWPAVYHAIRFMEQHKPYELLSPPPYMGSRSRLHALGRRISLAASGRLAGFRERNRRWNTLVAYRKRESRMAAEKVFDAY